VTAAIPFSEFVELVESICEVSIPRPAEEQVLGLDFEFSSIQALDVLLALEDIGAVMEPDVLVALVTIGDLYQAYARAFAA
jgi:hypothetical protein